MQKVSSFLDTRQVSGIIAATILSFLLVALTTYGVTTIGSNVNTGGTLTASGATTLNGNVTLGDAAADNIIITGNASTTNEFEVGSNFYVNGFATTTGANGNFETAGTLTVTGASNLNGNVTLGNAAVDNIIITGNASTTNEFEVGKNLYVNGFATTTGSNGDFATKGTLTVGDGTALTSMVFGTCNLAQISIPATTTTGIICSGATGITTSFTRVFVQATSSLIVAATPNNVGMVIASASSTGSATIGVELTNLAGAAFTPRGTLNFWATR